jgi:hypothetical protein
MPIRGINIGATTVPTRELFRKLPDAVPKLASAISNYTAAYAAALPALSAPGGMAATLRAAPELAANMDAWLRSVRATPLIPVRRVFALYSLAVIAHASCLPYFGSSSLRQR